MGAKAPGGCAFGRPCPGSVFRLPVDQHCPHLERHGAHGRRVSRREVELRRARANLDLAHQALDLYLNAAEPWFPRDPAGDARDGTLLKTALAFYEQIASQNSADPFVQTRIFAAYDRVGDIRAALGDDIGADGAYRKAMGIMVNVMNREPEDDVHRAGMAAVLQKFGNLLRKKSIYLPAEWSVSESVRLFRLVLDHNPSDPGRRIDLAQR